MYLLLFMLLDLHLTTYLNTRLLVFPVAAIGFAKIAKFCANFVFASLYIFVFAAVIYIYSNILLFCYFSLRQRCVISTKVFFRTVRTFLLFHFISVCILKYSWFCYCCNTFLPQSNWRVLNFAHRYIICMYICMYFQPEKHRIHHIVM